jgi:hypothetical protein
MIARREPNLLISAERNTSVEILHTCVLRKTISK